MARPLPALPRARAPRAARAPPASRRSSAQLRGSECIAAGDVAEERGDVAAHVATRTSRPNDGCPRLRKRLHARPRPRLRVRDPAGDRGAGACAARVFVEHRYQVTEDRVEAQLFALEVVENDDGVPACSSEKIRDGTRVAECVDRSVERDDRNPNTGAAGERADEGGERVGRGSRAAARRRHHRPAQHTRWLAAGNAYKALRRRRDSSDWQLDMRPCPEIPTVRRLRYGVVALDELQSKRKSWARA